VGPNGLPLPGCGYSRGSGGGGGSLSSATPGTNLNSGGGGSGGGGGGVPESPTGVANGYNPYGSVDHEVNEDEDEEEDEDAEEEEEDDSYYGTITSGTRYGSMGSGGYGVTDSYSGYEKNFKQYMV